MSVSSWRSPFTTVIPWRRLQIKQSSNEIFDQEGLLPDALQLSDYAWVWGQFIDHDITLSPDNSELPMNISVPAGDVHFDPDGTGTVIIRFVHLAVCGVQWVNAEGFPTIGET